MIPKGGVLVIGQEQDTPGGGFEDQQSFIGELTNVQLWDFVLPVHEINALSLLCYANSGLGNVLAWPDFVNGSHHGAVNLVLISSC